MAGCRSTWASAESVAAGRESLAGIADSATELVLTRRCADVGKVTHLLRAHGPAIQQQALQRFDDDLSKALALASGGPLHEEALMESNKVASARAGRRTLLCLPSWPRDCSLALWYANFRRRSTM